MSYAQFEASLLPGTDVREEKDLPDEEQGSIREMHAAEVYSRAFRSLRESQPDAKEEAVMLLEAWRQFEISRTSGYALFYWKRPLIILHQVGNG